MILAIARGGSTHQISS